MGREGTKGRKLLKLIDKIYFRIRDWFDKGAVDRAYDQGLNHGADLMRARILSELQRLAPHDFKSQELKLGFIYAQGIVKDAEL